MDMVCYNVEIRTSHTPPLNHHGMLLLYKYKTDVHILLHHTQGINLPNKSRKLEAHNFQPTPQINNQPIVGDHRVRILALVEAAY